MRVRLNGGNVANRPIREFDFYNGGDKREEMFTYPNPTSEVKGAFSYWRMEAPKQGFFKVPMEMPMTFGSGIIGVDFADAIIERYGDMGVVMVDPLQEPPEDSPFAKTKEDAKTKGAARWKNYCRLKVREFEDENEQRIARSQPRTRPSGFISHAYKELGLSIPQEERYAEASNSKTEVEELKDLMKKQQEQIDALLKKPAGAKA
jgi:hypothetical protein